MVAFFVHQLIAYPQRVLVSMILITLGMASVFVGGILGVIPLIICLLLILTVPLALRYPRPTFLTLLVVRNMVDIMSDNSLFAVGGFTFNLSSLLGVLMIAWGVWYFFTYRPIRTYRGNIALILFLCMAGMSIFTSLQPMRSMQEFIKFLNLALIFIFAYDYTRTWRDFQILMFTLGTALIVPSLLGVWQMMTGSGLSNEISNRIFGTYGHPNVFAFGLGLSINIWLIISLLRRAVSPNDGLAPSWIVRLVTRIPPSLVFIVFTILLAFTYTRGAWIGVIVSLLIIGLRYARRQTIIAALLAALLVITFPYTQNILKKTIGVDLAHSQFIRRLSADDENTGSWQWRLRSWQEVSVKFHNMPFFGYGIGTFQRIRENTVSYVYDLKLEAHNDYLRLGLETGYVGLVSYLVFLGSIALRCARASFSGTSIPLQKIYFMTTSVVVGFLIMSISDNILHATAVDWLWWALMGATCALISLDKQRIVPNISFVTT